jgi:acyl carrier protein
MLNINNPDCLTVNDVPNIRTKKLLAQLENIKNSTCANSIRDLCKIEAPDNRAQGMSPSIFFDIHPEYYTDIFWAGINKDDCYNITYYKRSSFKQQNRLTIPTCEYSADFPDKWAIFANNPLKSRINNTIIQDIRSYLKSKLPEYMQPTYIVQIDDIPLTSNNKIDYKKLPPPQIQQQEDMNRAEPANEFEEKIRKICKDELQLNDIELNEILYNIGANSINIVKIQIDIENSFNIQIPFELIYQEPTVKSLASYVQEIVNVAE